MESLMEAVQRKREGEKESNRERESEIMITRPASPLYTNDRMQLLFVLRHQRGGGHLNISRRSQKERTTSVNLWQHTMR